MMSEQRAAPSLMMNKLQECSSGVFLLYTWPSIGVRLRLKKQQLTHLPLPSLILGNTQSLRNKLDELQGNARFIRDYKDCCVMAFTESWFTEQDSDTDLFIDGFGVPFRQDRNAEMTGKSRGGVCACTSTSVTAAL